MKPSWSVAFSRRSKGRRWPPSASRKTSPVQISEKLGCRGTVTGELVLDNVRVPEENLLGEEVGKGFLYLQEILNEVRCMTGALAIGIARTAIRDAVEYAEKRSAFGRPIGKYQLIRSKFGQMATELEASRLL